MTATMNRAVANRKKNNKGFSLVELIIVIAIMAILTALLAPQFLKYVERSRLSRDEANLALIERSIQVALVDETTYKAVSASSPIEVVYATTGALTVTPAGAAALKTELEATFGTKIPELVSNKYKGSNVTYTITFDTGGLSFKITNNKPA